MDHQITLRECVTDADIARFWEEKDKMLLRDIVPGGDLGKGLDQEDMDYFLGGEYRSAIERFALRERDPMRRVFFALDGREVGFALYCVYGSEDGKCFVLEFCVYPQHRCAGVGAACFAALRKRAKTQGAAYYELNTHSRRSVRFWQRQGFLPNGYDEWGVILLCRPPARRVPLTVSALAPGELEAEGWQLRRLLNGLCAEAGRGLPDDGDLDRLCEDARGGKTTLWIARRGSRWWAFPAPACFLWSRHSGDKASAARCEQAPAQLKTNRL